MSLLCNPVMWQHQHTYAHHSFTNSFEHDPDLHHFSTLLRVHRRFQQKGIYQYQRNLLFVIIAYAFVVFGTCLWIPIGVMKEGTLYGVVEWNSDRLRPVRAASMLLHWIGYFAVVIVPPFYTHASVGSAIAAVAIHMSTSGLMFALFSQINHLNEASLDTEVSQRRKKDRRPELANSWAVSQIETSNNFATDSIFWHLLSNGLNLQIEHHLFPGLNHCHLHHITPVVKQTCEDYGVCYKSYSSWTEVFCATRSWLDRLSLEPDGPMR